MNATKATKDYVYDDFLIALEVCAHLFDVGYVKPIEIDAIADMFRYLNRYMGATSVKGYGYNAMTNIQFFLARLEETRRMLKDFRSVCLEEDDARNKMRWQIFDKLTQLHELFSKMKSYYEGDTGEEDTVTAIVLTDGN